MISRDDWLKQSKLKRLWQILFCSHPWDPSEKIGTIRVPEMDSNGMQYNVHVRQCGVCRQMFVDEGHEYRTL